MEYAIHMDEEFGPLTRIDAGALERRVVPMVEAVTVVPTGDFGLLTTEEN